MNTETTTTSCLLSRSQALSQLSPFSLLLVNILADGPELMHTILYIDDDRIDNKTATPLPVDSEAIYVCDRFMSGCATLQNLTILRLQYRLAAIRVTTVTTTSSRLLFYLTGLLEKLMRHFDSR